jgi:hypothetical protein
MTLTSKRPTPARRLLRRAAALLSLPLLLAPAPAQDETGLGADPVVLRIDGLDIRRSQFERWLLAYRGEALAKELAHERVVQDVAREMGVELDQERVEAELDAEIATRIEHAYQGDRDLWLEEIHLAKFTPDGYRLRRGSEIALELLGAGIAAIGRVVPETKIQRDWELEYGPNGVLARVRAIFEAVPYEWPEGGETREERNRRMELGNAAALAKLGALRAEIEAGRTTFAAAAVPFSNSALTAGEGGLVEEPIRPALWPKAIIDEITSREVGEITVPLVGRGGVWMFEVVSREHTPLAQVRQELERRLLVAGPEPDEVRSALEPHWAARPLQLAPALTEDDLTDLSRTALTVGETRVSLAEYARWMRVIHGQHLALWFAESLELERRAVELQLDLGEAVIEQRVEENLAMTIDRQFRNDRDKWLRHLESDGSDEAAWRREARERARLELIAEALYKRDRVITEDDVRSRWLEQYGPDGVLLEARFIAREFPLPEPEPQEEPAAYNLRVEEAAQPAVAYLRDLSSRVDDGEDFGRLARQHSQDPLSAVLGGAIPGGFDLARWSDPIRRDLLQVPVGRLSSIHVTPQGTVYLFEVTKRTDVPFESVAETLRREIETVRPPTTDVAAYRIIMMRDVQIELRPALIE